MGLFPSALRNSVSFICKLKRLKSPSSLSISNSNAKFPPSNAFDLNPTPISPLKNKKDGNSEGSEIEGLSTQTQGLTVCLALDICSFNDRQMNLNLQWKCNKPPMY